MDKDSLLNKFLHSELTEPEMEQFTDLVSKDAEFAEDVKLHSLMYAHRSKELKSYLSTPLDSKTVDKPKQITLWPILRNIAAIFVLGAISYFSFQALSTKPSQNILEEFFNDPYASTGQTLSGDVDKTIWNGAMVHYSAGDYASAEADIRKLESPNPEQELYLALTMMYQKPPSLETAIKILTKLDKDPDNIHQDATYWYLSLAYLKAGQKELAKPILNKIVSTKQFKHQEAEELLNNFEDL